MQNKEHQPMEGKEVTALMQLISKVKGCSTISRQAKSIVTQFATELLTTEREQVIKAHDVGYDEGFYETCLHGKQYFETAYKQ